MKRNRFLVDNIGSLDAGQRPLHSSRLLLSAEDALGVVTHDSKQTTFLVCLLRRWFLFLIPEICVICGFRSFPNDITAPFLYWLTSNAVRYRLER